MANLEQNVPEVNPGIYAFWPRPGQQPQGNKGLGLALGEAGRAIPQAAEAGIDIEHKDIEAAMFTGQGLPSGRGLDAIRDDYTGRLQSLYDNLKSTDPSLFGETPGAGPKPPVDLQRRMKAFDALDAAKASGKYSETYLYGQYVQLAKELRSQFGNMRDYVDERVDRSTGRGIANRYVAGLVSDINSFVNQKDEFVKDTDKAIMKQYLEGDTSLGYVVQGRQNGTMSAQEAAQKLSQTNQDKFTLENMKRIREAITGDLTLKSDMAKREGATYMSQKIAGYMDSHEKLIQRLSDPSVPDTEKTQIADLILAQGEVIRRDAISYFQKSGLARDLGDGWMTTIDNGMQVFQKYHDWLKSNETTPIKSTARYIQAKKDEFGKTLLESDLGEELLLQDQVTKLAGPQSKLAEKLATEERMRNVDNRINAFITHHQNVLLTGGVSKPVITTPEGKGQGQWNLNDAGQSLYSPKTFGDVLKDSKTGMDKAGLSNNNTRSSVWDAILKTFEFFTSKDTSKPIKDNLEHAAFDKPWLSTMDQDGTGKVGSSITFAKFTSPQVDKEIFTKYPKDVQQSYVNWKTYEFAHTVFPREINTLDRIQGLETVGKFGYNTTTHHVEFQPNPEQGQFYTGSANHAIFVTPQQKQVQEALTRLNMGLDNMANLAGYTGEDPNAYILRAMKEGGLRQGPVYQQLDAAIHHALDVEDQKAANDARVQ